MREEKYIDGLDGRKEYTTYLISVQKSSLDPLQGLFEQLGACIIKGCAITVHTAAPMYDIAAGIVAVNHADGYKLAWFAGVSNVNLSAGGYISITKTPVSGLYVAGTDEVADDYTASFTAGAAPVPGNPLYLTIPNPASNLYPKKFADGIGAGAKSAVTSLVITTFPGSLDFWVNAAARTLNMRGSLQVTSSFWNVASGNGGAWPVISTQLPAFMRPATRQYFTCRLNYSTAALSSWFKDVSGAMYITHLNGYIEPDGTIWLNWLRPAAGVSDYTVYVNEIMLLD